jgi:glycosyltransferase involved in cell wall biosynthesis
VKRNLGEEKMTQTDPSPKTSNYINLFGGASNNPSTRFRLEQYLPYFEKQGYKANLFTAISPPQTLGSTSRWDQLRFETQRRIIDIATAISRLGQIGHLESNSILLMNGFLTPMIADTYLENMVKKRVKKMILDLDDAIFVTNIRAKEKLINILKMCNGVTVGNEYLYNFVNQYNANVAIIPTPVETKYLLPKHPTITKKNKREVTIGWMGSWTNIRHLQLLTPVFEQLKKSNPYIRIVAVSNLYRLPSDLSDYLELKQWDTTDELLDLQSFDIGIMPLEDNAFTRGKCAFKLLQYMAVGIPVVGSPVGMNKQVIKNNGFLCSSTNEWIEALEVLCSNSKMREEMGKESRKICEFSYGTEIVFPKLLSFIEKNN